MGEEERGTENAISDLSNFVLVFSFHKFVLILKFGRIAIWLGCWVVHVFYG